MARACILPNSWSLIFNKQCNECGNKSPSMTAPPHPGRLLKDSFWVEKSLSRFILVNIYQTLTMMQRWARNGTCPRRPTVRERGTQTPWSLQLLVLWVALCQALHPVLFMWHLSTKFIPFNRQEKWDSEESGNLPRATQQIRESKLILSGKSEKTSQRRWHLSKSQDRFGYKAAHGIQGGGGEAQPEKRCGVFYCLTFSLAHKLEFDTKAAQMKRRGFATTECHSFLDPTLTLRFGVEEVGKGVRAEGRERGEEIGEEGISAETGRAQEGPPIPQPFRSNPPSASPANNLSSSYFGLKITYSRKPPSPG